ncbi:MAG TPA: TIGR01777 family oxidoreductase [Gemmatimonadaceae bacterium]|jgi:hypothetical protein
MTTRQDQQNESGMRWTIAISGSSGLIGSALVSALSADGHVVKHLVRREARNDNEIAWNPTRGEIDASRLNGVDAVVNLAGAKLDQRWSDDVKREIRESRINSTTLLARTIASVSSKPRVMVSGSAIGIYGDRDDELLDESSTPGSDFLATVCQEWEGATRPAEDAGVRVVHSRTGVVLAKGGGALPRMAMPFKFGVGGKLGSGEQWMSWIALVDMVAALRFAMTNDSLRGPMNAAAPNPVRNEEMTQALSHELHRPALFTVPRIALKAVLGEMADEAVLASQRVMPLALQSAGFTFALPTLEQALASIL